MRIVITGVELQDECPTHGTGMAAVSWALALTIFLASSALYGFLVSLQIPMWLGREAFISLLAAHSLSWVGLLPLLRRVVRLNWAQCLSASAVTMTAGAAVMFVGAVIYGWTLSFLPIVYLLDLDWFQFGCLILAFTHGTMLMSTIRVVRSAGVPGWKAGICWILGFYGAAIYLVWRLYLLTSEAPTS